MNEKIILTNLEIYNNIEDVEQMIKENYEEATSKNFIIPLIFTIISFVISSINILFLSSTILFGLFTIMFYLRRIEGAIRYRYFCTKHYMLTKEEKKKK